MEKRDQAKKDYLAGMKYKDIATKYGVSESAIKQWKKRYWDCNQVTQKVTKVTKDMPLKKKKKIAEALILEGNSISEAAKKIETPIGTVGRWSSEENLQSKQLDYLKSFRDEYRTRIRENKIDRLDINEEAKKAIKKEISKWEDNGMISKAAMEKLIMNEEMEQLIFELDRIERLEKLELDRIRIAPDINKAELKVDEYFSMLVEVLKDDKD